jgi:hypothetical protein
MERAQTNPAKNTEALFVRFDALADIFLQHENYPSRPRAVLNNESGISSAVAPAVAAASTSSATAASAVAAAPAASAVSASAAASTAPTFTLRSRFINHQRATHELSAVERRDHLFCFSVIPYFGKTKAAWLAGKPIAKERQ